MTLRDVACTRMTSTEVGVGPAGGPKGNDGDGLERQTWLAATSHGQTELPRPAGNFELWPTEAKGRE